MIALYTCLEAQRSSTQLLTAAAAAFLRCTPQDPRLTIVRRPGKRPEFPHLPGCFFSVSHSGNRWMCAAARVPLGLDLQQHQACQAQRLAARFFHPEEIDWLHAQNYAPGAFFQIWTRKEAYVKYLGIGITQGLDWFSVVADGALRDRLGEAWFLPVEAPQGFSLCLCSQQPAPVFHYSLTP